MNNYTQNELESLEDKSLDKIVAIYLGYGEDYLDRNPDNAPSYCNCRGIVMDVIGDILTDNSSIEIFSNSTKVCIYNKEFRVTHQNLLRAIVISYILMKQELG